jgi:hypothetical protein
MQLVYYDLSLDPILEHFTFPSDDEDEAEGNGDHASVSMIDEQSTNGNFINKLV